MNVLGSFNLILLEQEYGSIILFLLQALQDMPHSTAWAE